MTDLELLTKRYIGQSRLARENPTDGPWQHQRHAEFLSDVLARLGTDGPPAPPELQIVSTVNAEVETLDLAGKHVLIFDRDFGQTLATLNGFLVDKPQPEGILSWGLSRIAASLAIQGDSERAFAALSGSVFLDSAGYAAADRYLTYVAHGVLLQEYFAIAHECAHMAMSDGGLGGFTQIYGQIVRGIADQFGRPDNSQAGEESWRDPLVMLQKAAIGAILRDPAAPPADSKYEEWLSEVSRSTVPDLMRDAPSRLREELTCDAIATELTLDAWSDAIGEAEIIEAIFNGLSNLLSSEYVRFIGRLAASRSLADPEQGLPLSVQIMVGLTGNMQSVIVRRIVWRRWLYARAGNDDETWATLTALTERYEQRVSVFLQLLPGQFRSGYDSMRTDGSLVLNPVIAAKMMARGCDRDVLDRIAGVWRGAGG